MPIINKPKHPKRGKARNKMEGPTSKNTEKPPKRANHEGNIKFLNPGPPPPPTPLVRSISNNKREDLLKGHLA
jgi:hypothetical protein